jgi:hypothetical protein
MECLRHKNCLCVAPLRHESHKRSRDVHRGLPESSSAISIESESRVAAIMSVSAVEAEWPGKSGRAATDDDGRLDRCVLALRDALPFDPDRAHAIGGRSGAPTNSAVRAVQLR